jgi:predicted phosphodiesterase
MASHTLAKIIYGENTLLFKDAEEVRSTIRYYRGKKGGAHLKRLSTDKYLSQEKRIEKYNLPESLEKEYKPYVMTGNHGLIIGDIHIPFHSVKALETMFDYTIDKKFDFIVLNGDIMDCFDVSDFCKEPDLIRLDDERYMTIAFLEELKRIYPNAKIYYKFGNHEKRFEHYMMSKAPELFGMKEFRLEVILNLFNLGIEYISEDKYIDLSGLSILHAHEYKNGITSPANPARTLYLRTKSTSVCNHHHQTSEHNEPSINGTVTTCWSVGCLCGLHPKYAPLNKWNHGFAIYKRDDDNFWHVQNKKILNESKVV